MKNRTAMLFAFLLLACAVASAPTVAEEPFFVHGVSFGMTGEEVKAVMGEPFGVQAKDNLAVYTYVNVRFDKFSDGVFGCFLVDDRTALIAYQLPEGIMAENASWIESVLTQRYGKPVKDEALAGNVMELMMHYGLSPNYSVPRRAMWQSGDIYIVLFTDDAHLSVVCCRAVSENGYNTDGL